MILLEKFRKNWEKLHVPADAKVLLAVSGGRDSMVMADLFLKAGLEFGVAHCNFSLRAEASDLDEQLVKDWCLANNIQFHSTQFDTRHKADEWKKGIQETARILRYEWFELVRDHFRYAAITTAHHGNDNAETLLINLFKGTGISGLHGIPETNGPVIRPLLFATQEMISAYAGANNINFREDASNASDDYLRNAVRHQVIPVVEQLFPGAVQQVNESIARFAQAEVLYKKAVEAERRKLVEKRGQDHYIAVRKLRNRQPLETICYELVKPFGFNAQQVPHILELLDAESGKYIASASHRIIRDRELLVITAIPTQEADLLLIEAVPCVINSGRYAYSFSIKDKPQVIPADPAEAYIDSAGLQFPLVLRAWRTGDYLYPLGMGMKKKKVSRLMIDAKLSTPEKEEVRILECGRRIAWVAGLRLDERFKVTDKTKQVLVVSRRVR